MRMKIVMSFAVVLTLSLSTAIVTAQKPTVTKTFHVEGRGALGSLEALWSKADIVVEGVIEGDHPADYNDPVHSVNTMYAVRLLEVFKPSASVTAGTQTIQVRRTGGTRDEGDRIVNYFPDNYALFKRGERYVMFLTQHEWVPPVPYVGTYFTETTKGPDSIFRVTPDGLTTFGQSSLSSQLKVLPPAALRARLRGGGR